MIKPITSFPQNACKSSPIDENSLRIAQDLCDTLRFNWEEGRSCCSLSANQIGENQQILVVSAHIGGEIRALFNPKIIQFKQEMDFWEEPGDDAEYPLFGYTFQMQTDKRVEKVHSVSLKQITLGYDMSRELSKKLGFSGVRFFFTMENLFYLSNYSGENPEVVDVYTGIDNGNAYPLPRKYSIGLTLNF